MSKRRKVLEDAFTKAVETSLSSVSEADIIEYFAEFSPHVHNTVSKHFVNALARIHADAERDLNQLLSTYDLDELCSDADQGSSSSFEKLVNDIRSQEDDIIAASLSKVNKESDQLEERYDAILNQIKNECAALQSEKEALDVAVEQLT